MITTRKLSGRTARPVRLDRVPAYLTQTVRLPAPEALATLSPGERRAFELSAMGFSVKVAASLLGLSPKTIDRQLQLVGRKLGIRDRVLYCRYAQACGILDAGQLTDQARMVS